MSETRKSKAMFHEGNSGNESRRINEFEWLRVFAAGAVVMIHVLAGISDNVSVADVGIVRASAWGIVQVVIRWAVPVFLMITGALLLNPEKKIGWGGYADTHFEWSACSSRSGWSTALWR